MAHGCPLVLQFVSGMITLGPAADAGEGTGSPATGVPARGPVVLTQRGLRLHRDCLVIDGHNDLPWEVRELADSSFDNLDIAQLQPRVQTDIPRLRQGGIDAQFFVVYVPPETEKAGTAAQETRQQFKLIHEMVRRYADAFTLARTADDIERITREGKIAALIGLEGGHMLENSLDRLREYYELGARYLGLTHGTTIDWADSATDAARHGGLTPLGEDIVREMNRLGMLVDLAHVSADTMRDALRVSRAPVISSHSGAYAVAAHNRNVPDDVLRMIRDNGGLVMVVFFPGYIEPQGARIMARYFEEQRAFKAKYPDPARYKEAWEAHRAANPIPSGTVHTVVDHIDHIVRVAGIDHVGLGSDFDGVGQLPLQLEDVSGYPYITQALLDRGYAEDDIRKILGGNLLRVMRKAEEVARQLRR